MKRETARRLHETTNITFWFGNPEWSTGGRVFDAALLMTRPLWRNINAGLMHRVFDAEKVLAVNGETVVAKNGDDLVDKHMFRYPGDMGIDEFQTIVAGDVELITSRMARIALPTSVGIKSAQVFRNPRHRVDAVTQTQRRLDLDIHPALDLDVVREDAIVSRKEKTARDLEYIIDCAGAIISSDGMYPDIARSSGNVRRSELDGSLTLIDVMPIYENGSRAIQDKPIGVLPTIISELGEFEEFVGAYGA